MYKRTSEHTYSIREMSGDYTRVEWMSTRMDAKDVAYTCKDLSGISARCDWFVCREQLLRLNDTHEPRTVFMYMRYGNRSFAHLVDVVVPLITTPFVLIMAGADYTFPNGTADVRGTHYTMHGDRIKTLLDNPLLLRMSVENLDDTTIHTKVHPIPLGILPHSPSTSPIVNVDFSQRDLRAFCCHRLRSGTGQWADRALVSDMCSGDGGWSKFVTNAVVMSHDNFMDALRTHTFCICVHGGGIDPSPRCWEAILRGCIPVIKHSTLDAAYARLPVVFVDDWTSDAITEDKMLVWREQLRHRYEDPIERAKTLRMLTLDYWWDEITKTVV